MFFCSWRNARFISQTIGFLRQSQATRYAVSRYKNYILNLQKVASLIFDIREIQHDLQCLIRCFIQNLKSLCGLLERNDVCNDRTKVERASYLQVHDRVDQANTIPAVAEGRIHIRDLRTN